MFIFTLECSFMKNTLKKQKLYDLIKINQIIVHLQLQSLTGQISKS